MSEEEIIKELEYEVEQADYHNTTFVIYDKEYIRKIIDLYNKEKEKNEELDEKFRYAVPDDMIDELYVSKKLYEQLKEENQTQRKQLNDAFDRGWIHKDKIKKKKEQLIKEADYKTADNPAGRVHFHKEPVDYQIEALQELLEE